MSPAESLRAGAQWLEDNEWCQGYYNRNAFGQKCAAVDARSHCILGALLLGDKPHPAAVQFHKFHGIAPFKFNDQPNQTKENVIQAMREAADGWDKEQCQ